MSVEAARQAVEVLAGGDASRVVELRAFGGSKTISGYFNDHEALAEKARALDATGHKVYVTLNEVNPALLSRHANRASNRGRGESNTSDNDILRRRWLPVDLDPVRPSGVSATDEEKEAAKVRAREGGRSLSRVTQGTATICFMGWTCPTTRRASRLFVASWSRSRGGSQTSA